MLIAITTPLFPRAGEPYRGWPIYKTVEALENYADVRVFSPVAIYPATRNISMGAASRPEAPPCSNLSGVPGDSFAEPSMEQRGLRKAALSASSAPAAGSHIELLALSGRERRVASGAGIGNSGDRWIRRGSDLRRIQDPVTRRMVSKTVREADYVLTVSEELRQRAISHGVGSGANRGGAQWLRSGVFFLPRHP